MNQNQENENLNYEDKIENLINKYKKGYEDTK